MTRDDMDRALGRMVSLRNMPGETDGYWTVLQRIPDRLLEMAVDHALRTRTWFPTPAEVLTDCDAVRTRAREPEPEQPMVDLADAEIRTITNPFDGRVVKIRVVRDWKYYCDDCDDTGQKLWWCGDRATCRWPWVESSNCGKRSGHAPHDFMQRCSCWYSNPALITKRARDAKYSDTKAS